MPQSAHPPDTVGDCYRLDTSWLRRRGLFRGMSLSFCWGGLGQFTIEREERATGKYLRLRYATNGTKQDYCIELETLPSNLPGVEGQRYLMVCPVSGRRAAVLFLRDGTNIFAHRLAYGPQRLYYSSQLVPSRWRELAHQLAADDAWEKNWRKGRKLWYKGKPTRWHEQLLRLERRAGY